MNIIFHVIAAVLCTAISFAAPSPSAISQAADTSASAETVETKAQTDRALSNSSNAQSSQRSRSGQVRTVSETDETPSGEQSSSAASQPEISPRGSCTQTSPTSWGSPYTGATGISGTQDRSAVRWYVDSSCVLHLSGGTSPDISNSQSSIPWDSQRDDIVKVKVEGNLTLFKSNIQLNPMFTDMYSLTSFDTTGGTLHLVESAAAGLLDSNTALTTINSIANWDTSQTTGMPSMFYYCTQLTQLDLSGFNTAKVEDLSNMFTGDAALTSVKLGSFSTGSVTSMSDMFTGCTSLDTLDISHFNVSRTTWTANMLPNGLRRLKLGSGTKLSNSAFSNVDSTITWKELSSLDSNATLVGTIGTTSSLATRAASANPAGSYIDQRLMIYGAKLVIDANYGTTNFVPVTVDTTNSAATLTVPQPNVLTANRPTSLFAGWNTCRDGGTTGGCRPYSSGDTISVSKGDSFPLRTITLYAQWTQMSAPLIDDKTPVIHAPLGGNPTVDLRVSNTAAPTGSTTTVTTGQGTWSTETGPGTWNYTNRPVANLQPNLGVGYSIRAVTSMTDPITGNAISTYASKNGVLPYARLIFNANGGTGAPGNVSGFGDASNDNLTAFTIPTDTIPTKGAHDMFAGWSTNPNATQPDAAYNPGNHSPTWFKDTGKTTTLYAVWHTAKTPTITEAHRDPSTNQIVVTGTGQPWSVISTPTVSGTTSRGLKVTSTSLGPDGKLSLTGLASGTGSTVAGEVVIVHVRACTVNTSGPNGTAPPAKTGWSNTNSDIPAGCTQISATPAYSDYPSYPTWLSGINTSWSANLNVSGYQYIWVYAQFQGDGGIDGPLMVTPDVQGSDNSVKACVKPAAAASSAYVCGNTIWDSSSAAWDGTASHQWTLYLPRSTTFDRAGNYDIKANLNINDTWRTPSGGIVSSEDATLLGTPICGLYLSALPLTGDKSHRLAILMAAIVVSSLILLAVGADFRYRPRRHFRRQ